MGLLNKLYIREFRKGDSFMFLSMCSGRCKLRVSGRAEGGRQVCQVYCLGGVHNFIHQKRCPTIIRKICAHAMHAIDDFAQTQSIYYDFTRMFFMRSA